MALLFQQFAQGKTSLNSALASLPFMQTKTGLKPSNKDSRTWFREKALSISSVDTRAAVNSPDALSISKVRQFNVGQMLMFFYDPKFKEELPYYDRFPLIFVLEVYRDGFLGINLHYLPIVWRAKLMDAIYSTINNKKYDETTKLKLNYQVLKNTAKMRMFKPCIKRYLTNHVKSNMIVVEASDWDYAAFLPLQRFAKAKASQVYADSLKQV